MGYTGSPWAWLAEENGQLGTLCIYEASSPEKINEHASRTDLPVTEIVL